MEPTLIRKRNLRTFNEIAEEYDHRRKLPWNECVTPLSELRENAIVLDLAAGTGRQTFAIAQHGCDVVAVDFSANMLVKLKKNAADLRLDSQVSLVASDITVLPFRDVIFDGIEMVAALHNLPTKQLRVSVLSEIHRVTIAGGKLVVTVWLRNQRGFYRVLLNNGLRYLMGRSEWGDVWVPWGGKQRFYHLFSQDELSSLVSTSGFHICKVEVKTLGDERVSGMNRNILLEANKI